MLFSDAIEQYEEVKEVYFGDETKLKGSRINLRQIALFLGNPNIEYIDERHIVQLFRMMLQLGWKKNAIRPKATEIRNFLKYWRRRGLNVLDPELIPMPRREPSMPRVANPEHLILILNHMREKYNAPPTKYVRNTGIAHWRHLRNRACTFILRDSGTRIEETLLLNDDINVDTPVDSIKVLGKEVKIWSTLAKTGKSGSNDPYPFRQIFWFEEANEAIKQWLDLRPKVIERFKNDFIDLQALFFGVSRWQYGKRLTSGPFSVILANYSRELGIPTVNAHSVRHLFAHDTVKAKGAVSPDLMNFQGYKSIASATPYVRMYGNEVKDRFMLLHSKRLLEGPLAQSSQRLLEGPLAQSNA